MNKKALTAAIAASLAAPMAAQAVDFTISGHVNRGLFITDTDDASTVTIANNGSSATRIRATGSGELDTGHTAGIQLEYQEKGSTLDLRHANVHFSGAFGKITLGQGSEAGDSSAYSDKTGVFGIGHGQDMGESTLGDYFPSLDAGGRTNMIRYDTPALGPVGFAVSGANDDQYSAKVLFDMEAMGADIRVQLAYLKSSPSDVEYDYTPTADNYKEAGLTEVENVSGNRVQEPVLTAGADVMRDPMMDESGPVGADGSTHEGESKRVTNTFENVVKETIGVSFGMKHQSGLTWSAAWAQQENSHDGPEWASAFGDIDIGNVKPTYLQTTVGYVFGNNAVGLSWWDGKESGGHSEAEFTSIGVGFIHTMPKAGVDLYAAVQNYDATDAWGGVTEVTVDDMGNARLASSDAIQYHMVGVDRDETVAVVGARVRF